MRKPKTNRVERTRAGGEWTEAAFWGFVRSGLRSLSRRWPPIVRQVFNESRRKYTGPNKRQKWEYECCECGEWKMRKEVQADHIEPCGRLCTFDAVGEFLRRMLCEVDGLRVVCKKCHQVKTNRERKERE